MTSDGVAEPFRVLTVCLGNICRSPMAEAAIVASADRLGVPMTVDSAGTSDYHIGAPPDERMTHAAARRGFPLRGAARQVRHRDFEDFDLILAMDASNEAHLRAMAPPGRESKVVRFRTYDPAASADHDVPDPYFGGAEGFDEVVTICARTAEALVASLP